MKHAIVAIALVVLAAAAPAQVTHLDLTSVNPKTHFIWVHGGLAAPFGELYKRTKLGGGGGIGFGFCPLGSEFPDFETILRGQGFLFPANADHGDITIFTTGLDLKIRQRPPRRSQLYLLIGGGFSRASQAAYTVSVITDTGPGTVEHPKQTESKFYVNAGFGIEYEVLGKSRVFFELRATDVSGDIIRDYIFVTASAGIGF